MELQQCVQCITELHVPVNNIKLVKPLEHTNIVVELQTFPTDLNNITCLGSHVKCPTFLPDFNQTWTSLTDFNNVAISNFTQIQAVEAKLIHVNR
jgi:hypothetical protein